MCRCAIDVSDRSAGSAGGHLGTVFRCECEEVIPAVARLYPRAVEVCLVRPPPWYTAAVVVAVAWLELEPDRFAGYGRATPSRHVVVCCRMYVGREDYSRPE